MPKNEMVLVDPQKMTWTFPYYAPEECNSGQERLDRLVSMKAFG